MVSFLSSRFKNFFLLLACFVFFLFRGRANRPQKSFRRILVSQQAKLGDMVCTTPVFVAIKKYFPGTEVFVAGREMNKILLYGHPSVTTYFVIENDFFSFWRQVRKAKFSVAITATPDFATLALLYLAGVPLIIVPKVEGGWSPYETFSYRLSRRLVVSVPHIFTQYAPREYLRLLEPLGIFTDDTTKTLSITSEAKERISSFFRDQRIHEGDILVGISPSSGNKIKNWGGKNFAEVASRLAKNPKRDGKVKIIIVGGERDKEEVREFLSALPESVRVINTGEKLLLEELKALIARLHLFIAVDTGPIYIAEAFGVPTVDIVGPMDENGQPPRGEKHMVVVPPHRKEPMLHIMNARVYDIAEARRQVESITPEMVIEAAERVLM